MSYTLRPYQITGSDFLVNAGRAILADDMGLGKTLTTLDAVHRLGDLPALVIAPKIALYVWQKEISKWFEEPSAIYSGEYYIRNRAWKDFQARKVPFLITNYAFAEEIRQRNSTWGTLICDEIHLAGLLNRKTQTFKHIRNLARASKRLFQVTGTPMRQTPADLWAPLHLVSPREFSSYWRFVQDYCVMTNDGFGMVIERRPASIEGFRDMLKCYLIRRLKKEAMPWLPPKTRQPVYVDMTARQAVLYNQMARDYVIKFSDTSLGTLDAQDRLIVAQNQLVATMRLRQLLVTPQILGLDILGGALKMVPQMVENEFMSGNPVAIFTPFKEAIPFIERALHKLNSVELYIVHGKLSAKKVFERWNAFQDSSNSRRAFICTIKSGTSFDLYSSAVAYFIGYEWDSHMDVQAEDRLHRDGQKDNVRVHYLIHKNTVDEDIMQTVAEKQDTFNFVLNSEDYRRSVRRTC